MTSLSSSSIGPVITVSVSTDMVLVSAIEHEVFKFTITSFGDRYIFFIALNLIYKHFFPVYDVDALLQLLQALAREIINLIVLMIV